MRRVAVIAFVLGLAGCITPSIPIPPPDPASMDFTVSTGTSTSAVLTYPATSAYRGGIAYVYNETLGTGIIQSCNPDGSIGPTEPTAASLGNQMIVSIQVGDQTQSSCVVLQQGQQDPTHYCN